MTKTYQDANTLVDIYNSRSLGANWREIDDRLKLPHSTAYRVCRIMDDYLKTNRRGKKRYANYIYAAKTIKSQQTSPVAPPNSLKTADNEATGVVEPMKQESNVYNVLEKSFKDLQAAIEEVIQYEVTRRVANMQKENEELKALAKNSNWVTNLQNKFQGAEKKEPLPA